MMWILAFFLAIPLALLLLLLIDVGIDWWCSYRYRKFIKELNSYKYGHPKFFVDLKRFPTE
jgi:hypothetical protein